MFFSLAKLLGLFIFRKARTICLVRPLYTTQRASLKGITKEEPVIFREFITPEKILEYSRAAC